MRGRTRWTALITALLLIVPLGGCGEEEAAFVHPTAPDQVQIEIAVQRGLENSCRSGVRLFAEQLASLSGNTFALSIVYVENPYQAIRDGEADVAYVDNDLLAQTLPEFQVYTSPFYLRDYAHTTMSLNSPNFHTLTEEDFREDYGFLQLAAVWAGSSVIISRETYLSDVQDFADITIAIDNDRYLSELFSTMGARVTQMARLDRYEQFGEGEIETIECRTEDLAGLDLVAPRETYLAESFHRNRVEWLLVSAATYQELTSRQQAALEEAAAILVSTLEGERQKAYEKQRDALELSGVEVTRFSYDSVFRRAREILYANRDFYAQMDWNRYDTVLTYIR